MPTDMSFTARETSRHSGQPDTLYRFGFGTRIYGYTDAERPVTFGDVTYRPIPIDRNAITSSGTLDKSTINIQLPIGTEVVELFRVFPPSDVVGVTIFQGHDGEDDFVAIFMGRVLSAGRKGRKATLNCEPAATSMRRPGLRRRWQYPCPHVLYGPQCRANRAAFTVDRAVQSISGAHITLPDGWAAPFQQANYQNGIVEWAGPDGAEVRNILSVNDNVILIDGRPSGLAAGVVAKLSLGCRHTMDDCLGVFANIHNYGGDPWIPTKNPIGMVNQFY